MMEEEEIVRQSMLQSSVLTKNDNRWLLPIEWKYTEKYGNSCKKTGKGRPEHYREFLLNSPIS